MTYYTGGSARFDNVGAMSRTETYIRAIGFAVATAALAFLLIKPIAQEIERKHS